jgi:hypothetical protein
MRVLLSPEDFGAAVADDFLAAKAEDHAAEIARGLEAPGLMDADRRFLEAERDRLTNNARALRSSAERKRGETGGNVVQMRRGA